MIPQPNQLQNTPFDVQENRLDELYIILKRLGYKKLI